MKKILSLSAVLIAAAVLTVSCNQKKVTKIGILQLVEHSALTDSYRGFVDGLKEAGYEDKKNISIDYQNAQGEQANCATIATKFVSDRDDLILAIATPAAQAVAAATDVIPVLVTAVTDPASAGLAVSNDKPGKNISGTSDLTPCSAQIDLLVRLFPDAKKIAMLYCSSEENSKVQIAAAKKRCDEIGLEYVDATVSNTNEVQQVVQSLVGKVDAIYTPTDNMIASTMPTVATITTPNKIPVICGEEGMVASGGLATYGINYYELGKQTAAMAVEVLNGKNPADMPIQYQEKFEFKYNSVVAEQLGVTIPEDLL